MNRGQHYTDLMPGGDAPRHGQRPKRRHRGDLHYRREIERLSRENADLRGQVDALTGEIESLRRQQADHYERGARDRDRNAGRFMPSILGR